VPSSEGGVVGGQVLSSDEFALTADKDAARRFVGERFVGEGRGTGRLVSQLILLASNRRL
jgi:hypothetical protein